MIRKDTYGVVTIYLRHPKFFRLFLVILGKRMANVRKRKGYVKPQSHTIRKSPRMRATPKYAGIRGQTLRLYLKSVLILNHAHFGCVSFSLLTYPNVSFASPNVCLRLLTTPNDSLRILTTYFVNTLCDSLRTPSVS